MDATAAAGLSDDDFIAAFEQRRLNELPHRFHIRVAWIYIKRLGLEKAMARVTSEIRALASERGQTELYHETITRAWMYIVADAALGAGPSVGFDALLESCPELLDKTALLRYFRPETLASPEARAAWVAPDLRPLPGAPASQRSATVDREPPITAIREESAATQVVVHGVVTGRSGDVASTGSGVGCLCLMTPHARSR